MKVLFVNQFYYPDVAATAQIMADLAEHLVERGHEVHVLCSRGQYDDGSGRPTPRRELHRGVHIHRVTAPGFGKKHLVGRMLDYAGFHLLTGLRLLAVGWRYDAVVTLTTPPLIGLYGTAVKWLTLGRTRHVCWAMDLHPDCEFELGMWSRRHPLYRGFDGLNGLHFRKAHAAVVLGEAMADRLRAKGVADRRLHVIPVWSRSDRIDARPLGDSPLRAEHGLADRFVVMYSGNAGLIHSFDAVCEAMRRLDDDDRIRFLFVGGGRRLAEVEQFAREHGLSNLVTLPYFPRERLNDSLAMGDVHLVTLRQGMAGVAVPCKTYGIMAAGRAVIHIGPVAGETADHVREAGAGVVIPVEAPDAADMLEATIRRLAAAPDEAAAMGRRGREKMQARFDRPVCCGQWTHLLESLR